MAAHQRCAAIFNSFRAKTRNAVELMVTQPGVSTPTNPRSSSINGLPKGTLNVTIDGMKTQDNPLKSSNGFFSYIYTPIDAVEEITLSTSATVALGGGEGAANIRFTTRSGTNSFSRWSVLAESQHVLRRELLFQ
jgi:hypothetical protein